MKLQVALDYFSLEPALKVLEEIHSLIDIVEIGTPLILNAGVPGIQKIRQMYPDLCILADLKIMDGGFAEADMYYQAGADIVTVMGIANLSTIEGVAKAAKKNGGLSAVDMMVVPNLKERALEVEAVGADIVSVHTAFDVQKVKGSPYEELQAIREVLTTAQTAIAGGVKIGSMDTIREIQPDIIIVGGAIVNAEDKVAVISQFREKMG